ncbi:MAG: recombinase family protein [Pirellulaceae bacterium]|nr:recombinase family protein [Pirellulaceae bacterium]
MILKPTGTRGCAYVRVSHGDTEGKDFRSNQNPEAQRTMILKWAERHRVTITRWYMDVEGRNPRDMAHKRKEFQQLIEDVQNNLWDWVVVDSQDRIDPADRDELGYYLTIFRRNDCELWSVDASQGKDGLLTSTDMGAVLQTTVNSVTSAADLKERGKRQVSRKREHAAKGEWQGGYVPYGFDVVCLDQRTNKEVWRVVIKRMIPTKGIWERIIVYPPQKGEAEPQQERCDGKDAFPKKQDWQKLELAPSIIEERVETVQEIFRLFASGAWTVRGLCQRLNQRHIDPVVGEGWYHTRLFPLLKNPLYYVGQTVWGKQSHGKNAWYVGGEYLIPPRKKGRPLTGRKNPVDDWVFPPAGTAIVAKELFDQVQARLNGRPEFKRGLRDERLWLAGLMICDRCGQKMSGWSQGNLSYYCTTYAKYGKENTTGCRLHRVSQAVIEEYVDRYLDELGIEVKSLVESGGEPSLIHQLQIRFTERAAEFMDTIQQMREFLEACGHSTYEVGYPALFDLYEEVYASEQVKLEAAYETAREELKRLMVRRNEMDPRKTEAIEVQEELIAEADRKAQGLKERLVPLMDRLDAACEATTILENSIKEAQSAIGGDDARRKALALRKVVAEIRLTFRHFEHRCRDRRAKTEAVPRSTVHVIEFVPVQGGHAQYEVKKQTLTVDCSPGPG